MKFFDSHCHPQLSAFDADRSDVLARMRESGTSGLVVGVDLATSRQALDLARANDNLSAAVGLHPNDNSGEEFDAAAFEALAKDPRVAAIGECGLDFFRSAVDEEGKRAQRERFAKHIDLALATGKPLIIHCRPSAGTNDAHEEMLAVLGGYARELADGSLKAVIHFFTSTADIAGRYLALGCYISFPGVITFAGQCEDAVRAVPIDRILSETDSPFAAPVPHRGKRNEPSYVQEVVRKIASLKGIPLEEAAERICATSRAVFSL